MTFEEIMTESNRIKGLLNECENADEVHLVADAERTSVKALAGLGGEGKTQAHQIANLKASMLHIFDRWHYLPETAPNTPLLARLSALRAFCG